VEENRPEGWSEITDPGITAALLQIHDRPQLPWTVSRLSAAADISRTAFTRRFTSLVGKPPMAYVIDRRLGCAARLLRESNASLAEIARKVGYCTEFAFAAAFRREYGVSPGRFRSAAVAGAELGLAPDLR
jgi:AraC-like DNA-binding protein